MLPSPPEPSKPKHWRRRLLIATAVVITLVAGEIALFPKSTRRATARLGCRAHLDDACVQLLDSAEPADEQLLCQEIGFTCSTCIHGLCGISYENCQIVNARCPRTVFPPAGAPEDGGVRGN